MAQVEGAVLETEKLDVLKLILQKRPGSGNGDGVWIYSNHPKDKSELNTGVSEVVSTSTCEKVYNNNLKVLGTITHLLFARSTQIGIICFSCQ